MIIHNSKGFIVFNLTTIVDKNSLFQCPFFCLATKITKLYPNVCNLGAQVGYLNKFDF